MKVLECYLQQHQINEEYIRLSFKLRKMINKTVKNTPKSYRFIITNNMLNLAQEVTNCCLKSMSIVLTDKLTMEEFKNKQFLLRQANQSLIALKLEIVFLFEMLNEGCNVFQDKSDKIFDKLIKLAMKVESLINNKIEKNIIDIKRLKKNI